MELKKIRRRSDLAIHGAPPAFNEVVHVGRPNIGPRDAFLRRVEGILDRKWLTNNGPLVQEFETQIADYLGVKHCVAMCNGTIALEIAIRALDLTGEVIVPSWTFIATAHALHWQEITPIFADIDPQTHNLDPVAVRKMITPRTSGIIGVHLWGRGAPVGALKDIADEFGLALMFDAAHAFGCSTGGLKVGGFGACEVLSFHATKAFNCFEGGAVVTNDTALTEKIRLMRNFGFSGFDNVIHPGTNGKLTEICAAMGLTNLESFPDVVSSNRRSYLSYLETLAGIPGISVLRYDESEHNNFQYVVIEVSDEFPAARDEIVAALQGENILARKYFWPGCHLMKPYRDLYPHTGHMLKNTESLSRRVLVLPNGTGATPEVIDTIGDILRIHLN